MSAHTRDEFHTVQLDNMAMTFACTAPVGSPCRSGCEIDCAKWTDGDDCEHPKTVDMGHCNIMTWLEEMDGTYDEGQPNPPLPIEYRWTGFSYAWRLAP